MSRVKTFHDTRTNVLTKELEIEKGATLRAVRHEVGELWNIYVIEDGKEIPLCSKTGREMIWVFAFVEDCIKVDELSGETYDGTWASFMWLVLCMRRVTNFYATRMKAIAGFIYMWAKLEDQETANRILDYVTQERKSA